MPVGFEHRADRVVEFCEVCLCQQGAARRGGRAVREEAHRRPEGVSAIRRLAHALRAELAEKRYVDGANFVGDLPCRQLRASKVAANAAQAGACHFRRQGVASKLCRCRNWEEHLVEHPTRLLLGKKVSKLCHGHGVRSRELDKVVLKEGSCARDHEETPGLLRGLCIGNWHEVVPRNLQRRAFRRLFAEEHAVHRVGAECRLQEMLAHERTALRHKPRGMPRLRHNGARAYGNEVVGEQLLRPRRLGGAAADTHQPTRSACHDTRIAHHRKVGCNFGVAKAAELIAIFLDTRFRPRHGPGGRRRRSRCNGRSHCFGTTLRRACLWKRVLQRRHAPAHLQRFRREPHKLYLSFASGGRRRDHAEERVRESVNL